MGKMTSTQKAFVEPIYNALLKYAPAYNIKCYPAILSQAILESGWGSSPLSKYYNFFGMKCGSGWSGKSVSMATSEEYTVGVHTPITATFRGYDSLEEGVKGYLDFINWSRYSNLKGVTDTETYIKNIKLDGYATSSTYVTNLMRVVNDYGLEDYTIKESIPGSTPISDDTKPTTISYYVQCGAYKTKTNAKNLMNKLTEKGYGCVCKFDNTYYRIQCGAFISKENATKLVTNLKANGFSAFITTSINGKEVKI